MTIVFVQSFQDTSRSLAEKLSACRDETEELRSSIVNKDDEISRLRTDNKHMAAEIAALRSGRNLLALQQRVVDDAKKYCRVSTASLCGA